MNIRDIEINRGELWIEKSGSDLVRVEQVIRGLDGRRAVWFSHDDGDMQFRTSMGAFSRRYQYHTTPPSKKYKPKARRSSLEVFAAQCGMAPKSEFVDIIVAAVTNGATL